MLTTLSMLKKKNINIFICIMHRYLRLTPVLAIAVLMHSTILRYFGNGPCWNIVESNLIEPCRNNWWMTLLYVQNYLQPTSCCVPQSWYLAVDMHGFIVATIIIALLKKSMRKMVFVTAFITLTGIAVTYFICYGLRSTGKSNTSNIIYDSRRMYYTPTHTRFPPYMIGMLCGLFMKSIQSSRVGKCRLTQVQSFAVWSAAISFLAISTFMSLALSDETTALIALYDAVHRSIWSLGICSIILMCFTHNGGIINKFLSLKIFQVLSKLTYCIYIFHFMIIHLKVASLKTVVHFSIFDLLIDTWGSTVIMIGVAFLASLTFELPIFTLENYVSGCIEDKIIPVFSRKCGRTWKLGIFSRPKTTN
nr:nose resistant to fluoxetine protein 6-like [Leptinotarsa decemlineata]